MKNHKITQSGRSSFFFPALSIRQQLPLLICLLLVVLIILFGSISYLGVRRASIAVGEQRIRTLTEELSSMFQQNGHTLAVGTQALAAQDDIVDYFAGDAGNSSSGRAREALKKMLSDSQTVRADLRDLQGKVLLAAGRGTAAEYSQGLASATETRRPWTEPDVSGEFGTASHDSNFVGRLYLAGDSMFFPIIALVYRGDKPQGYLLRWRPVRATQKSNAQLAPLLGTRAALYFGNVDGSLWTDLLRRVGNTSPAVRDMRKTVHYKREGGEGIAYSIPITCARWVMTV